MLLRATLIPQRWPACRGDAGSFGRDPDVLQYLVDVCAVGDEGNDAHLSCAVRADQREHFKDTGKKYATEIKVRAERRCGELLRDMEKNKGERGQFTGGTVVVPPVNATPTLAELGIEKHESSRWQKLAAVPETEFEPAMATALEVAGEVTTQVIVAVNVETSKRDRYGRQIGKVLVNGRDVNLVQVERGMAWFYRQYQREQSPNDRRLYEAAEDAARADKRGLWRDADPVPPWEFRHNKTKP